MSRPPFFIRQIKTHPQFDGWGGTGNGEVGVWAAAELLGTGPDAVAEYITRRSNKKKENENRILNISNNLDSVRTYGWQAEFNLSDDEIITDTPRLSLSVKSFDFPNYTQAKNDFAVFGSLISNYSPYPEQVFKFTFLDTLVGGDVLAFLIGNEYLSISKLPTKIPLIYIKKFNTDGEPVGGMVFTDCFMFGLKHGNIDYQAAGGMLEHSIDVRWSSVFFVDANGINAHPSASRVIETYKNLRLSRTGDVVEPPPPKSGFD